MTAPRERPILFNGPMIRALLAGTKTQTRRVVKPQPNMDTALSRLPEEFRAGALPCVESEFGHGIGMRAIDCDGSRFTGYPEPNVRCPYGVPGDRLWVRETWGPCDGGFCYRASEPAYALPDDSRWHPSIHMPRAASRITLDITDVRVERLQAISTADAWAEGIQASPDVDPVHEYRELWDSLNAARGFGWDANPWVWVIGFNRTTT